ncbi:MAG: twin-arginine translocation signal domain-containing protein, partial [Candidatus Levyibacteriota bacterium]
MTEDNKQNENNKTNRRDFLRKSLIAGSALTVGAMGLEKVFSKEDKPLTGDT